MLQLDINLDAFKVLERLDAKRFRQIIIQILALLRDPRPQDASELKGYEYLRIDSGEFRVVYKYDDLTVYIVLIGKRNDDEVYKRLANKR